VQEAAQLAGVEVLDIGLSAVNHGHGAGVPPGCSYNTASKAAIFNSNAAVVTSGNEKYQQACVEESDELPRECAARLFLYPSAAFAYGVFDNNVTSLNSSDFEETSELIARYAEQLQGEEVEVELPFEQPGPLWIARGGSLQMDELFSTAWRDGEEEEAVHRVRSYADGRSVAKVDIEDTPDQFKAGALAHYRLLTHPCRTDDPAEADLFFYAIPRGYKPDAAHCQRQGAELELLKQRFQDERGNISYMERHGGRDHFTVLGRSAWDFDTCHETHGLGSALGEAFRVSVDGGPIVTDLWEGVTPAAWYQPGAYLTVPAPSITVDVGYPVPADAAPRGLLASIIARTEGHSNREGCMDLRKALHAGCGASPDECVSTEDSDRVRALRLYANSTFCLMPTGDWPSRVPATQDCLAMGAIPVFFHETQLAIWPDAAGGWLREAVIFIDQKDVQADDGASVLATLRAVGATELERKRALVRKHFGRMVWAYQSGEGDVFDRVLELAADYARGVDSKLRSGERVSQCCQHTDDDSTHGEPS